jgi:hypothetical protein
MYLLLLLFTVTFNVVHHLQLTPIIKFYKQDFM